MSKYIPGNQKHLTPDDRIYIQNELSRGTFYNAKNFCIHRYHCKKLMPVGKSFLAVSNALLALPAIKLVPILSGNTVTGLIKLLMSAMAMINRFLTVPLHTNTRIMLGLLTVNIGNALRSPDLVST